MRDGDLRYVGQGYELKIPFPEGELTEASLDEIWRLFHEAHKREYGHYFEQNPIEIVNVRVTGVGAMPKIAQASRRPRAARSRRQRRGSGNASSASTAQLKTFETTFYRRALLPVGETFAGPAIVLQNGQHDGHSRRAGRPSTTPPAI